MAADDPLRAAFEPLEAFVRGDGQTKSVTPGVRSHLGLRTSDFEPNKPSNVRIIFSH
jgi:hypothetical protein